MTQEERELVRLSSENERMQKKIADDQFKRDAKVRSFSLSPTMRTIRTGANVYITTNEKIKAAEKIYQWLIKDLK